MPHVAESEGGVTPLGDSRPGRRSNSFAVALYQVSNASPGNMDMPHTTSLMAEG
jgi:hypothetical protein